MHEVWNTLFEQLKRLVKTIVEVKHFDILRIKRIVCDVSHDGLGAILKQLKRDAGQPIFDNHMVMSNKINTWTNTWLCQTKISTQ